MIERVGTALGLLLGHALRVALPALAEVARALARAAAEALRPTALTAAAQPELKNHLLSKLPARVPHDPKNPQ